MPYSVIIDSALGVLGAPPKRQGRFPRPGEVAEGLPVRMRRRRSTRSPSTPAGRKPARRCSRSTAPAATPATGPARRCRSPRSAPTAAASTPGTRAPRSRPTRWSRRWAWSAKGWSKTPLKGYNPPFLDGIWLHGPYLHNGSVPTLRDLLQAPREPAEGVLARLRRLRPGERRLRRPRRPKPSASAPATTRAGGATATADTTSASTCRPPDKEALLEYLKTL